MNTVAVFGADFSRRLMAGCRGLEVPPEWVLSVLALESGYNQAAGNPSGARGLWQKMPDHGVPYDTSKAPAQQLADAFVFWGQMRASFKVTSFGTRGAFYCLNLAPARLADGRGTPDRILYSSRQDLHPAEYSQRAYEQNIGLDPVTGHDAQGKPLRKGWIEIRDLEAPLDRAVAGHQARFAAELASARALDLPFPVPPAAGAPIV